MAYERDVERLRDGPVDDAGAALPHARLAAEAGAGRGRDGDPVAGPGPATRGARSGRPVLVATAEPGPASLRPFGARSSHWYIPHSASRPRA